MADPFPWNGSELVYRKYNEDNYRIIHTGSKTGRAIIFFSSNGIYYPNTESVFRLEMIKRDNFDYKNISSDKMIRKYYELIILVRDVYKQWYVNGINPRYNTADKTAELLREITCGYEVTTCGSSAGGYAAVLFASLLGAERFFSMSGQFSIMDQINKAPLVREGLSCSEKRKYFDITQIYLGGGGGGYYFYPALCESDIRQSELVKNNKSITTVPFQSNTHGYTMPFFCYPYLLTRNSKELSDILSRIDHNKPINQYYFAFKFLPLWAFIKDIVIKVILRKIYHMFRKILGAVLTR